MNIKIIEKEFYQHIAHDRSLTGRTLKRYRNHAIFSVFLFAALRKSELLNLKFADVDIESLTILVRQGKGQKDRMVPMSYRTYMRDRVESTFFSVALASAIVLPASSSFFCWSKTATIAAIAISAMVAMLVMFFPRSFSMKLIKLGNADVRAARNTKMYGK